MADLGYWGHIWGLEGRITARSTDLRFGGLIWCLEGWLKVWRADLRSGGWIWGMGETNFKPRGLIWALKAKLRPERHTLNITFIWRSRIVYRPNFILKLSPVVFLWFRSSIPSKTYLHLKNLTQGSLNGILRRNDHMNRSLQGEPSRYRISYHSFFTFFARDA